MYTALAAIPTLTSPIAGAGTPGLHLVAVPDGCGRGTAARAHALCSAHLQHATGSPARVLYVTDHPGNPAAQLGLHEENRHLRETLWARRVSTVRELDDACEEIRPTVLVIRAEFAALPASGGSGEGWRVLRTLVDADVHVTMYLPGRPAREGRGYRAGDDPEPFTVRAATGTPLWEPQPGDLPVPDLDPLPLRDLVYLASSLTVLYRPAANHSHPTLGADGVTRMPDTRAAAEIIKSRQPYPRRAYPLRFDIPDGGHRPTYLPT